MGMSSCTLVLKNFAAFGNAGKTVGAIVILRILMESNNAMWHLLACHYQSSSIQSSRILQKENSKLVPISWFIKGTQVFLNFIFLY